MPVSEVLVNILGSIPAIEGASRDDEKIGMAALHVSSLRPQPLALPIQMRRNSVRHRTKICDPLIVFHSPLFGR